MNIHSLLGLIVQLVIPVQDLAKGRTLARRDERGLSQSTENAVLLAGAVAVAVIVVGAVTQYVQSNMPK
ncbi:hypothetical protein ACTQ49_10190 [Luteococcus sp. Sow4_B9]|uniref:hypothetical protein n=1 Tax=Luteococcus sp. Sow4_B9 TaxID=3438792 RepID=UPI003F9B6C87